jgi:uncharacterized phage-associated protein
MRAVSARRGILRITMTGTWATTDSAFDVAAALIEQHPGLDQMQLHKLLYLTQAASLAWFDTELFDQPIEAWTWGPVVRGVAGHYKRHKNGPISAPESGDSSRISARARGIVERILQDFGHLPGPRLAKLVKGPGTPWRESRGALPSDAASDIVIPLPLIREYHRTHGLIARSPTEAVMHLAQRFLDGDREESLIDLMKAATGQRPRTS